MKIIVKGFFDTMSKKQRVAALIYLPVHIFLLPLLLPLIPGVDELTLNIIYYAVGFLFCLTAMWRYLRGAFDVLLDNKLNCFISFLYCYIAYYILSLIMNGLLVALVGPNVFSNPNNETVTSLAESGGTGAILALAVFIGPIVEETLFRGALFGSIRRKSRVWAYVASIAVFSLYHVWQYAVVFNNAALLLYALQYIPVSIALTLAYEKTNCIWTPILLHMLVNLVSMLVLT